MGFRRQGDFSSPPPTRGGGTLKFEGGGGFGGTPKYGGTMTSTRATNFLTNFYLKLNFFMENKLNLLTTKVTKIP